MGSEKNAKVEFGDFQTPYEFAEKVCLYLVGKGVGADSVVEPTCGVGAFVIAAAKHFSEATSFEGYDINSKYISTAKAHADGLNKQIKLEVGDFFELKWQEKISKLDGKLLIIGNLPWVTNAAIGSIGGGNLPSKSNFQGRSGFEAISGKANFDISEWMLIDILKWFASRSGSVAMLVKTAVARKILAYAEKLQLNVERSFITSINAKDVFDASVDACILYVELSQTQSVRNYDYIHYKDFDDDIGTVVAHRHGLVISDLTRFEREESFLGSPPQPWRSGIKHDASSVMELTEREGGFTNGLGEPVNLETAYIYPLLKGSDIGSSKEWRRKHVIVTQRGVGQGTDVIQTASPRLWQYLVSKADILDARGSSIYEKNPRFSIFGVGEYAFKPWKIAICGMYKKLNFRLVGPINDRPVMFDDTVYFVSFDTEAEAQEAFAKITSDNGLNFLRSLIFWDEKRPIKTSILNRFDWMAGESKAVEQPELLTS